MHWPRTRVLGILPPMGLLPSAAGSAVAQPAGTVDCQRADLPEAVFTSHVRRDGGFSYTIQIHDRSEATVNYTLSFTASGLPNAVANKQGMVRAGSRVRHELAGGTHNLAERTMRSLTSLRCQTR